MSVFVWAGRRQGLCFNVSTDTPPLPPPHLQHSGSCWSLSSLPLSLPPTLPPSSQPFSCHRDKHRQLATCSCSLVTCVSAHSRAAYRGITHADLHLNNKGSHHLCYYRGLGVRHVQLQGLLHTTHTYTHTHTKT